MIEKGVLQQWDNTKGSGFLKLDASQESVFLSRAALYHPEASLQVGDTIYCTVVLDGIGRKSAAHANIAGIKSVFAARQAAAPPTRQTPALLPVRKQTPNNFPWSKALLISCILALLSYAAYVYWQTAFLSSTTPTLPSECEDKRMHFEDDRISNPAQWRNNLHLAPATARPSSKRRRF